ncbi:MAG TPA: hypothetical protein VGC14_05320 [Rhizobium sp.]
MQLNSQTEAYNPFKGELEPPAFGEIIFADEEGQAHSRNGFFGKAAAL